MKRLMILMVVALLLLLTGAALAGGPLALERTVVGGGGGHAEAGLYVLDATLGQSLIGQGRHTATQLCSGFRCRSLYQTYLPIELRNHP